MFIGDFVDSKFNWENRNFDKCQVVYITVLKISVDTYKNLK